jgi:DNA-binding NtrC family response regulator
MNNSEASFPIANRLSQTNYLDNHPLTLPAPGNENQTASEAPISNPQLESMKIVVLALLNRIDALEEQVSWRRSEQLDLREEVNQFEEALIRAALTSTKGRQRRAARVLGMKVSTLNAKIKRYHVSRI